MPAAARRHAPGGLAGGLKGGAVMVQGIRSRFMRG
jgi:hypothetical protein